MKSMVLETGFMITRLCARALFPSKHVSTNSTNKVNNFFKSVVIANGVKFNFKVFVKISKNIYRWKLKSQDF